MEANPTIIGVISFVVTALIGFLIGKSGVLTKLYDAKIKKIETNIQKESSMIDDALKENKTLRKEVSDLTKKVAILESEINEYKKSMDLIIEYLKKLDISDPFLNKIIK
jgi:peptidoglycan hydrolase CwlO-like protein